MTCHDSGHDVTFYLRPTPQLIMDSRHHSRLADHGRNGSTVKAFNDLSLNKRKRRLEACNICDLPAEILSNILTCIDNEADRMVNIDRRGYLSQESFGEPACPSEQQLQAVGNFRLTCRRFSEIGAKHQFLRVTVRFKRRDFERLLGIASIGYLAQNVRKFSYMVPCGFYYQRGQKRLQSPPSISGENLQPYIEKQLEHRDIMDQHLDTKAITQAFKSFNNLQHVQLIKLQDIVDVNLEMLQDTYEDMEDWIKLDWEAACIHGTRTICEGLLNSKSPCTRFSSPHLNSNSAMRLATEPPASGFGFDSRTWYHLASQLTCLELHFDRDHHWFRSDQFNALPFKPILGQATNLEALHVGFPFPIAVRLEDIFHSIKWEKLVAFGIQGWELEASEIIEIARRHKAKLRGLRLRSVYIKEGSSWADVLHFLRNEMHQLNWVSLRHIGYQAELDARSGSIEVPEDFELQSNTDDTDSISSSTHESNASDSTTSIESDDEEYDIGSVSSQGNVPEDDADLGLAFPEHLEVRRSSILKCNCSHRNQLSLESAQRELAEDFQRIRPDKRKYWENWVVRTCPQHKLS